MAKQRASNFFSFVSGFVQDRNTLRVIAQADELSNAGRPNSTLMKWVRHDQKWYDFHINWFVTRMWVLQQPELQVFAAGPNGRVNIGTLQGDYQEEIDPSENGPRLHGDIRDLRFIGDHIYAAGMGRQIYRRESRNQWIHKDIGILQPISTTDVKGFNSIDGLNEDDILAVGFGGEIWHLLKGKWHKIESPTNVILNKVRVIRKDTAFACGQKGTLLRGIGGKWGVLDHRSTEDQIWDMEWFDNTLFLATDESLFRLMPDDTLDQVDMKLGEEVTCGFLHANDGVLLSVGRKHICWTKDGIKWIPID